MIGIHERDGSLRYAGTVKAELRPRRLTDLEKKTSELVQTDPQFYNPPPRERGRDFYWLEPELVVEASFLEWTPAGEAGTLCFKGCARISPPPRSPRNPSSTSTSRRASHSAIARPARSRGGAERWLSLG
ncbi:hypothetical protein [Caballeronia glathei]|uniref:ATP dependent DNA ligase n=1 Tax=Caballeronia glathei TaxID=60547 RepID=UPI001E5EB50B|nr:hypothetical protein [Caballeronia glathei]